MSLLFEATTDVTWESTTDLNWTSRLYSSEDSQPSVSRTIRPLSVYTEHNLIPVLQKESIVASLFSNDLLEPSVLDELLEFKLVSDDAIEAYIQKDNANIKLFSADNLQPQLQYLSSFPIIAYWLANQRWLLFRHEIRKVKLQSDDRCIYIGNEDRTIKLFR